MNRVFLTPIINNQCDIKDALDGKIIGTIKRTNQNPQINFKRKIKKNILLTKEVKLLLISSAKTTFLKRYKCEIDLFNKKWLNTILEKHQLFEAPGYPIHLLSCRLKKCGLDMFKRVVKLHPAAKKAWLHMQLAAQNSGIDLQIISAYRDFNYQQKLIENKLIKGVSLKDILKVNTLPGFSEHHTGCAIDIGSENEAVLESEFDQSPAFIWLTNNANDFGFHLTYPKDNKFGLIYEPWHWCFQGKKSLQNFKSID